MKKRSFFRALIISPFAAVAAIKSEPQASAKAITVPVNFKFEPMAPAAVRDAIMPEITAILEQNISGYGDRWREQMRGGPKQ